VVERPVANLGEFTHTLLAIRQEIDSTLDALTHRAAQPIVAPGQRSPQASRAALEQAPITLTDGNCDDPIEELGVIGCMLGLRSEVV
jgi:hypothetical protein